MDSWLRHRSRYRQIAHVLARHGFGFLSAELGLRRYVPFARHEWRLEEGGGPEHLREALQELGATFIKFGQLLSTRADLLPPDYIAQLSRLQDDLPPVPVEAVAEVIEQDLGASPGTLFAEFDPRPLAAASTSQVHAARLRSGEDVVVKVRRPGVERLFAVDLQIIQQLTSLAQRRTRVGRDYDLVGLSEEMTATLLPSLDYRNEARNLLRFAGNFVTHSHVHVPCLYSQYSSARVLTMERLHGVKITDHVGLAELGVDRRDLAAASARILWKTLFEDGFFHADPHPGNFFVMPGGRIGVVDYGLVGYLGASTRAELVRLFVAVVGKDASRIADGLLRLGALSRPRERQALVRDLERLIDQYYDVPLGEIPIAHLFADAMKVARRRGVLLPTNLALFATVVAANEGMARALDPDIRLLEVARPYARQLLADTLSPVAVAKRLGGGLADVLEVAPDLPIRLRSVMQELESGGLEIGIRSAELEALGRQINGAANRIAFSILGAALIIGCGVLLLSFPPSTSTLLANILLAIGFLAATTIALWLVLSVLRSR
ncbi:MAG: ABC1 kinase family protein [Chloroflexota bacterium]